MRQQYHQHNAETTVDADACSSSCQPTGVLLGHRNIPIEEQGDATVATTELTAGLRQTLDHVNNTIDSPLDQSLFIDTQLGVGDSAL